jgi:hypothetical protein
VAISPTPIAPPAPAEPAGRGSSIAAPVVQLEPCAAFVAGPDDGAFCDACGWTSDDHDAATTVAAHAAR